MDFILSLLLSLFTPNLLGLYEEFTCSQGWKRSLPCGLKDVMSVLSSQPPRNHAPSPGNTEGGETERGLLSTPIQRRGLL